MATFKQIANMLSSDLQRDFGLSKEQAIGLVGNLAMESKGFSDMTEDSPIVPGSRGGYGYAQWTGPRRKEFEAYVKAEGLEPDSYAANYGFLKKELQGKEKATLAALKKTDTVEDAARVAMKVFLRPGIKNVTARTAWTNRVNNEYAYVPPGDLLGDGAPLSGPEGLMDIHDRNAAARGYGELGPQPKTISPALQAARTRLAAARQYASLGASKATAAGMTPASDLQKVMERRRTSSPASDPLGVGDAGMSVTPRLPANFDPNNPGTYVTDEAEKRRLAASAVPMDQSGVQARATILDEGIGSLANPRSLSPATPNPKSNTSGLVEPGNIDINKRQVVKNADGTISTERSMSFEEDGIEVLVPTVFDGKRHSDEEAIQHYRETGEHLGKFSTPEAANKYAQSLHQRQDAVYNGTNPKPFVSQIAVRPEVIPSNTAKKSTAGASLSAPGAGLTSAQRNALTALPKTKPVMGEDSGAFWTGQGQAGKVAMPADVRPVLNRPLPATLAAPGAGLTAAQRNAMTSLNGVSLNPTVTKGAALMGAGAVGGVVGPPPVPASPITRTAAPVLQQTVRTSSVVAATPTLYQSGGYLYSKSGDGYVKVGKVGSAGPVVTTSAKSSGGSSSSSSSGGGNDWYRSVTDPMYNGG